LFYVFLELFGWLEIWAGTCRQAY